MKIEINDITFQASEPEHDKGTIRECFGYLKILEKFDVSLKGQMVLDVGAHRGFFTKIALANGADVVSVEPSSTNVKILRRNGKKATIYHGAMLGWPAKPLMLTSSSINSTQFTVARHSHQQRSVEIVQAYCFAEITKKHKVSVVKTDAQGSEWGFFRNPIPTCVKVIFGEIHYSGKFEYAPGEHTPSPLLNKKWTDQTMKLLKDQGFSLHFRRGKVFTPAPPYQSPKLWHQDFLFRRD